MGSMDSNIRNFKDFLLLYNRVTELCFSNCVDNFFSRNVATNESECVDKCVNKFARFNQTMMNVYVEVQTDINNRRVQELEAQTKEAEAKAIAAAAAATTTVEIPSSSTSTSLPAINENLSQSS